MGLDTNGTRFILYCRKLGVNFSRTATIGRQGLHLKQSQLERVLKSFGYPTDSQHVDGIMTGTQGYAERFLEGIGADEIHSFDNSDFEGATHLHDMNEVLPFEFKEQYTAVVDGGSLEHVFNFPVALKNCMEMVQLGGHFLSITPANNFFGHGFYQFSPELHFSVFSSSNGFELLDVIAFEDRPDAEWYRVQSPIELKRRVTFANCVPTYLLIVAKKTTRVQIFENKPQQSDYVKIWGDENSRSESKVSWTSSSKLTAVNSIRTVMPDRMKRIFKALLNPFRDEFFTPIDPVKYEVSQAKRSSECSSKQY